MSLRRSWFVAALAVFAACSRLLPHPPNFAPVAAVALFGAATLPRRWAAAVVPLAALLASDLLLHASYLAGCSSERRDLDVAHLRPRLEDQLLSIARSRVAESVKRFDRGVRWEQEGLDVHGTRWVAMYLPVWLYSYHQPGRNGGLLHYIAVNGRTGETMGSIPVQQWKLVLTALTVGTFLEGIALWIIASQ